MKLNSSFAVPAESTVVFAHFLDPESMRTSVPGCTELTRVDGTHYRGQLVNEIAHVRFSAGFSAEITTLREPEEVKAVLRGEDRKLGSSIKIDATLSVRPDGGTSQVEYNLDVALWGKIGRLGESIVRRRSQDVERQFVAAFSELCAAGPPGAASPAPDAAVGDPPAREPAAARPAPADEAGIRPSWWKRLLALFRRDRTT